MNPRYTVQIDKRVVRELRQVDARDREKIVKVIERLGSNPRPRGVKKLVNQPGWRIRIGNYRVLYEVDEDSKIVTVYRAGHRRDIYQT